MTAEQLHELLGKKEPVVVVDARTPAAFAAGHLEGAVNLNVMGELRYPPDATPRAMTSSTPQSVPSAPRQAASATASGNGHDAGAADPTKLMAVPPF